VLKVFEIFLFAKTHKVVSLGKFDVLVELAAQTLTMVKKS